MQIKKNSNNSIIEAAIMVVFGGIEDSLPVSLTWKGDNLIRLSRLNFFYFNKRT